MNAAAVSLKRLVTGIAQGVREADDELEARLRASMAEMQARVEAVERSDAARLGFSFRGVFDPRCDYHENDIVLGPSGAQWIAECAIAAGGDCPGPHWRLWLKQAKKGPEGRAGRNAPKVTEISVSEAGFAFMFDDGSTHVAAFDLRAFVLRTIRGA